MKSLFTSLSARLSAKNLCYRDLIQESPSTCYRESPKLSASQSQLITYYMWIVKKKTKQLNKSCDKGSVNNSGSKLHKASFYSEEQYILSLMARSLSKQTKPEYILAYNVQFDFHISDVIWQHLFPAVVTVWKCGTSRNIMR